MTAAALQHNRIVTNLVKVIANQLAAEDCEVLPGDMRLHVEAAGLYTYPDVTIVCGPPRLEDEHLDTLLNPTVLIEVLSDSTERYDRGRKSEFYRSIPSLQEYLLVRQDAPGIEHYRRGVGREWVLVEAIGTHARVQLASVDCVLELDQIYHRIF